MPAKDKFDFHINKDDSGHDEYHITKNNMPFIVVNSELVKESDQEITQWYTYLNNILGFVSFTFALGVQGTPNVYFNAALSLFWVLIAHYWIGNNRFPKHLSHLRNSKEEGSRNLAFHIEKHHLSYWTIIKKAPLFLIGYIYLLLLTLMNFECVRTWTFFGKMLSQHLMLK